MSEPQVGQHAGRRAGWRQASARENIEDHLVAAEPSLESFVDRGLDGLKALLGDLREHAHEAPVCIITLAQRLAQGGKAWGQRPVDEGCPIAQGAGLPGQNRHIMPGILADLIAPEQAGMLGHDLVA